MSRAWQAPFFARIVSSFTAAFLLLGSSIGWAADGSPTAPTRCSDPGHHARGAPEVTRVQLGADLMVEHIRGEAALAHLFNLKSRRPEAFESAGAALKARGFTPTEHVFVQRTIRLSSNRSGDSIGDYSRTQDYSEQGTDGEVVFWSWTDGDDDTWEGTIYMEVYSSEDASTWEGQIDASDQDHAWIYYQKTWDGGPGGGGPIEADLEEPPVPGRHPATAVQASWPPPNGLGGTYLQVGWLEWAKCWRVCVVAGCAAAAIACIASGPLWPGCFGASCTGALVGCGIQCYYDR